MVVGWLPKMVVPSTVYYCDCDIILRGLHKETDLLFISTAVRGHFEGETVSNSI